MPTLTNRNKMGKERVVFSLPLANGHIHADAFLPLNMTFGQTMENALTLLGCYLRLR